MGHFVEKRGAQLFSDTFDGVDLLKLYQLVFSLLIIPGHQQLKIAMEK
jgi:hypothetical protein